MYIKFESKKTSLTIECESYMVKLDDNNKKCVVIGMVEHPISNGNVGWPCAYVMNKEGKTIDCIHPTVSTSG